MRTRSATAFRALALRLILAAAALCCAPVTAFAQSPVAIGAPLTGEVVLNRDIEVRIGPNADARIIQTLPRGKALNALGTPRGTSWTEVAIGGQPIGYVPSDSLDPALMVSRSITAAMGGASAGGPPAGAGKPPVIHRGAAVVPRSAWEIAAQAPAQGYVVAADNIKATEILDNKKRRGFTLRKGDVVSLIDSANGRVTLGMPSRSRAVATTDGLIGVVAPYPLPGMPPIEPGPLFAARLGEYVSHAEGLRAWQEFTYGPGTAYRDLPPMVWPVFRGARTTYQMGVGPFTRTQVDNVCGALAQRSMDCWVIELETF
ncbi:SH3 domain-containing protein [Roseomonas genomospecies 6]|uniref:SH3 domain-containing protein n=1 Tax=Roseomonas genomospecies 6 TaxID=214106 RepID=A0A9W7U0P6_9PROT|nr:SH3 domain-containing protein [Roseomonas genomospecies 6]KAA0683086.1 SH3 domain-containing protein [Roseomonas genomospecies 6]